MLNFIKRIQDKLGVGRSKFIALSASLLMFIPLLVTDLVTKACLEKLLLSKEDHIITVIKGFFALELSYNQGAFFGLGGNTIIGHVLLIIVSVLGALVIGYFLFFRYKKLNNWEIIGLGLMMPGDVGNLIDRCVYSSSSKSFRGVIDFLRFNFGSFVWPNFNVADSLLVIGIICLFLGIILTKDDEKEASLIEEEARKIKEEESVSLNDREGKDENGK